MVVLWNRAYHYIFIMWILSSFFSRLISVAAHWMSTILPYMVWPRANLSPVYQTGLTTGCIVYTNIQPVVPVWQPVERTVAVRSTRLSNRLSSRFDASCKRGIRMQVWNVRHAARLKCRTQKVAKNRHVGTIAQLCRAISSQPRHVSTIGKKLLSSNMSSRRPHNMVNISPLTTEIVPVVWGTPANFSGFRVLAALLHDSQVVSVS